MSELPIPAVGTSLKTRVYVDKDAIRHLARIGGLDQGRSLVGSIYEDHRLVAQPALLQCLLEGSIGNLLDGVSARLSMATFLTISTLPVYSGEWLQISVTVQDTHGHAVTVALNIARTDGESVLSGHAHLILGDVDTTMPAVLDLVAP